MAKYLPKVGDIVNANAPLDAEGRTYHLGVKRGEVCNRVISVGDPNRARLLADMFDDYGKTFCRTSNRGFTVYTGRYKDVPVTVIATGMGTPMMDFVVRESRAIVDNKMAFVRLGTCGTPYPETEVGTVVVADKGSLLCTHNVDAWLQPEGAADPAEPYRYSGRIPCDQQLCGEVTDSLRHAIGEKWVAHGLNCTTDFFYSTQGRTDPHFDDRAGHILDHLRENFPEVRSIEMETAHLYHLANVALPKGSIVASAACIAVANRSTDEFIKNEVLRSTEAKSGAAVLDAITKYPMSNEELMLTGECVWLHGKLADEFKFSVVKDSPVGSPRKKVKPSE